MNLVTPDHVAYFTEIGYTPKAAATLAVFLKLQADTVPAYYFTGFEEAVEDAIQNGFISLNEAAETLSLTKKAQLTLETILFIRDHQEGK